MNHDLMDRLVAARLLLNFSDIDSVIYFSEVAKAIFNEAYATQFARESALAREGFTTKKVNSLGETINAIHPSQIHNGGLKRNTTGTRQPKVLGTSNKKPVMGRKVA